MDFLTQIFDGKDPALGTSTGQAFFGQGDAFDAHSPINGSVLGQVRATTREE